MSGDNERPEEEFEYDPSLQERLASFLKNIPFRSFFKDLTGGKRTGFAREFCITIGLLLIWHIITKYVPNPVFDLRSVRNSFEHFPGGKVFIPHQQRL